MSTDPSQEYPGLVPDLPGPDHRAEPTSRELISWLTPARRRALYLVAIAALGVGGVYGLVTETEAAAWAGLAAAALGLTVAEAHTPGKPPAARD